MNTTQPPLNHAEALGQHLAERVRSAARHLAAAAEALTTDDVPNGGYTVVGVELRALLDAVIEQAIAYDLYAGPALGAVAAALGVTERTARARYDTGPRDLPLLIALSEG